MNRKDTFQQVQKACAALGNPLKFQIFLRIAQEGCDCDLDEKQGFSGNCVAGLMQQLKLPQSTVSSYLKDLEEAGLIECQKNGKFLYCKPKKIGLLVLKSFIESCLI